MKATAFFTLLVFVFGLPTMAVAGSSNILLICGTNGCRTPRTKRQQDNATHLALTIPKAKALLAEIRTYKQVDKKKAELKAESDKLQKRIMGWKDTQLVTAESTIAKQGKALVVVKKRAATLEDENKKLVLKNAELKGQRYQFLMIGLGVGAAIVVVVGGGVAIGVALSK